MVQDVIQSFYWNNTQATIHPFVIYYTQNETLKRRSFVCFSDLLQLDVHIVHTFQNTIIFNVVKKEQLHIEKEIHFSDDHGGHYKNHKNFTNFLHQQNGISL